VKLRDGSHAAVSERASKWPARLPKKASAERRARTRFRLTLELRYAVTRLRAPVEACSGLTIDLSSSGLNFIADRRMLAGQELDVSIDWPVLLDGGVRLQLNILGVVVRTNGTATALQIRRHEFRTRRVSPQAVLPQELVG
jgi:hypothetical protein